MEEEKEKTWCDEIIKETEKQIETIKNEHINVNNIDYLYKLVDIHKDLKNEEYWKEKIESMKYRYGNYENYGTYGRRNYRENNNYGEYGARGNYRGEEALDGVYEAYRAYSESGSYGTQDNMQKIEMMTDSLMDFVNHVKKIAKTPEERQFIDRKIQELSEM